MPRTGPTAPTSSEAVAAGPPVVSIYEAKTNFSKLVKRAESGETIYIGAYGRAQAVLAPVPPKRTVKLGLGAHLVTPETSQQLDRFLEPDPEWDAMWEDASNEPLA